MGGGGGGEGRKEWFVDGGADGREGGITAGADCLVGRAGG